MKDRKNAFVVKNDQYKCHFIWTGTTNDIEYAQQTTQDPGGTTDNDI